MAFQRQLIATAVLSALATWSIAASAQSTVFIEIFLRQIDMTAKIPNTQQRPASSSQSPAGHQWNPHETLE